MTLALGAETLDGECRVVTGPFSAAMSQAQFSG